MANINEYSLYLASWEHLYLLPEGVPAGLPNQLFSRHPWAIILFEQIYCDENGLRAEEVAADEMKWTNAELFVRLASPKESIIKPLNLKTPLRPHVEDVRSAFRQSYYDSIETIVSQGRISVDELFEWRLKLLQPFLDQHRLVLYDWSISRHQQDVPMAIQKAVKDILNLDVAPIPLTKDLPSELSPERADLFRDLQGFESELVRLCRMGQITQREALEIIKVRAKDHREIEIELVGDVEKNLERIFRLRERFGRRGGWALVQQYLEAFDRLAHPKDLKELDDELRQKLNDCFKPLWSEYGSVSVKIAKSVISFLPHVGTAKTLYDLKEPVKDLGKLAREQVQFLRGRSRL